MLFNKLPFTNKYEGETVDIDGSRHYVIEKDSDWKTNYKPTLAFPSITTVLSATDDPTWLENWRKRVGEEKANEVSLNASTKGTGLHSLCENYIVGEEINPEKDISGGSRTMFGHLKPSLDKHLSGYWVSEVALYSKKFRTAGRTDLIGLWDSAAAVIDFKSNHSTSNKKDENILDYKLQLYFYKVMWEELYPEYPKLDLGVLLIASLFHCQVVEFDINDPQLAATAKLRRLNYYQKFRR